MQKSPHLPHSLFILLIILLLPTFFLKKYPLLHAKKERTVASAPSYAEEIASASSPPFHLSVFAFSYNNGPELIAQVESIYSQSYTGFDLTYIDGGSTDESCALLTEILSRRGGRLLRCSTPTEGKRLFYEQVAALPRDWIVVPLHSSVCFSHQNALAQLASCYTSPEVWATYSYYEEERGAPLQKSQNRTSSEKDWLYAPFKSFYAGLYQTRGSEGQGEDPLASIAKKIHAHTRLLPCALAPPTSSLLSPPQRPLPSSSAPS